MKSLPVDQAETNPIPFVAIHGPTASGKSALALQLVDALDTPVLSVDSRQVYKHLDIGTAKPPLEMRAKHRLIDLIEPDRPFSAGQFLSDAAREIDTVRQRGRIPLLAGGTVFYLRSLEKGLFRAPRIDPEIRQTLAQEWETRGAEAMHRLLEACDPDSARRIHPNDRQRVLRALEIFRQTGICLTRHWENQRPQLAYKGFHILLLPPREELYRWIDNRVERMIEAGLIAEIERVLSLGFSWSDPGMNTLGYKQFRPMFESGVPIENCIADTQQDTRRFAKRQLTWYRSMDFDLTIDPRRISISEVQNAINAYFEKNRRSPSR